MAYRYHRLLWSILGFCIVILCACSDNNWRKLSRDEIQEILPELCILESVAGFRDMPDSLRQALYTDYFKSRGFTQADWDSTMAWYAKYQMVEYEDFYRRASEQLERKRIRLQAKKDSLFYLEQREISRRNGQLDSVNLLADTLLCYYPNQLVNYHFVLVPSSPYDLGTRLELTFRLDGLVSPAKAHGKALEVELYASFSDSTSLTIREPVKHNGCQLVSCIVPDSKSLVSLWGYIRGVHKGDSISDPNTPIILSGISLKKYPASASVEDTQEALKETMNDEL